MTSSDEISHSQTSQQLSGQQSSLGTMQLSSNIGKLSNDMQNLIQQTAASSQASTQDHSVAESNKFNMQSTDQNSRKNENILLRKSIDKNTESSKAMIDQLRVSLDAFKDKLSSDLQQLKDQQANQNAREENNDAQQAALSESNQAHQVAFTGGSPEQTQEALAKEHGAIADAATGMDSAVDSLGSMEGTGGSSGAGSVGNSVLGALGRSNGDVVFEDHPLSAGWETLTGLFSGWTSGSSAGDGGKGNSAIVNNTLASDGKRQKNDTGGNNNVSSFDDSISSVSGSGDGEEDIHASEAGFEEQGSAHLKDANSQLFVGERR